MRIQDPEFSQNILAKLSLTLYYILGSVLGIYYILSHFFKKTGISIIILCVRKRGICEIERNRNFPVVFQYYL